MKALPLIMIVGILLAGCANEAPYVDRELGMAAQDAFDRQIVYKDGRYADRTVEGLNGIHAEKVMDTYHNTFSDGFTQEDIDISDTGN